VEDRVVVEAISGERRKRCRRLRRGLLVQPDREVAAARLELDLVGLGSVERRRLLLSTAVTRRRLLGLRAAGGIV
jgi:hypothetical protein